MENELGSEVAQRLLDAVARSSDLVGVVDDAGRVQYLNDVARKRLGLGATDDLTTAELFPPEAFNLYYSVIRPVLLRDGVWRGELPVLTESGDAVTMAVTVVAGVRAGGEIRWAVTFGRDLATRDLDRAGPFGVDDLTGLPGRAALLDRMHVAMARAQREHRRIAVVFVDVDGMKDVNDSFGHEIGDHVLRTVARRLLAEVRTSDTVTRFGGDEFVVLFDGVGDDREALHLASRLRDAIVKSPIGSSMGDLSVTASFGLAVSEPENRASDILRRADHAMCRAKAVPGGHVVALDLGADADTTRLADEIAVAVSHGQIRSHVQPVVDLRTAEVVGYQGLARWDHHDRGLLEAGTFIDLVEHAPVAPVIDLAILRETARVAARSRADEATPLRAYGHASRRLIGDARVEHYLAEIVDQLDLAPGQLCVEVAHHLIVRRSRAVRAAIDALRDSGVRIVLTGVDRECDVQDLVDFGFDEVRLARELVRDALHDEARARLVRGIAGLARGLGLLVTAVGVEREEERAVFLDLGCDLAVGTLFGGPVATAVPA
ncbi:MAG TPA: EAL domain-containing protein [Acidimicrobiia bacterium]|nr:EAL domain-containing protein [Acidimicrobiia bacterium]